MKRIFVVLGFAGLTLGCMDADDIRKRPPLWTATYSASYDAMANCVAVNSFGVLQTATPIINAKEKRAEVLIYHSMYGYMLSQLDFRELADGKTEVTARDALRQDRQPKSASNPILNKCGGGPPLSAA